MNKPEFVALQSSILIRSDETQSKEVLAFLDTIEFKAHMQEALATLMQETLRENNVPFDEVIISMDKPPQQARPVKPGKSSSDKPSMLGRLFGKK